MNRSIILSSEQLYEMSRKADGLSYAFQIIIKRALQKALVSGKESFYGSDYNDCHGDYYDADYE